MIAARKLTLLQEKLLADGARCEECPLGREGAPGRAVPTAWDLRRGAPKLAVVGEASGLNEVRRGIPFCGASGRLFDHACRAGGVPRPDVAILNAAACGPIPSGQDAVKARTIAACRPRLIAELRRLRPNAILSLGGLAMKALAPDLPSGVTALRGALLDIADDIPLDGWRPTFLGSLHPAHILRGGDGEADAPGVPEGSEGPARSVDLLYYFLVYDLSKAWRLANGLAKPWVDDCDLFLIDNGNLHRATVDAEGVPVVGDLATPEEFIAAMDRVESDAFIHGAFACDVETDAKDSLDAHLTAVSFATVAGGLSATWAAWTAVPAALDIARRLLASAALRKVFHNSIYDAIVLPRHKLPVAQPIDDTLLRHHAAFPGLPHKLDAVAQQFLVAPAWKAEFRSSQRDEPGLILYCYRDSACTALIDDPIRRIVAARKTERVYECDRQVVRIAQRMREFGFWIDRAEQARQSKIQHARLDYMRESLTRDFAAIEPAWRDRLARNLAIRQRKQDPDGFTDRVALRFAEIAGRPTKPTDVGLLKTKAKADLVALFEVLRIPFLAYTAKGSPVTDKKAMEAAAAKHPLMRQLIHMREAQHVLATYIDGLPVKRTGRVHPDWSVTKIVGRWSAGKSQNIPKQVAGWPPREEVVDAVVAAVAVSYDANRAPRPGCKWRRKISGDYICPPENARALITAPTADEILAHALDAPDVYEDERYKLILDRALQHGHGRILVGADFNQLHLRIVALLGKDPFLLDAYARNADVHAMNAAICFPRKFPQLVEEWARAAAETPYGNVKPLTLKADLDKLDKLDAATRGKLRDIQAPWASLRDLAKRLVYAWIYRGRPEAAYNSIVQVVPEVELSAVQEAFRLLDARLTGWVSWCNRNEVTVRRDRAVREALHGRVRLYPLGNYDQGTAVNFPVIGVETALMAQSFFRFTALTEPALLDLDRLYEFGLLDPAWVAARRAEGFDRWAGPVVPLVNGHDSVAVECSEDDGARLAAFLAMCMDHTITLDGATMRFFGEPAVGRRLSEV